MSYCSCHGVECAFVVDEEVCHLLCRAVEAVVSFSACCVVHEGVADAVAQFLVCVADANDGRADGAQLYGAVREGGWVGVATVVGEDVDVDAGNVVSHVVADGVLSRDVVEVWNFVSYAINVEFLNHEISSCPASYDVNVGEV